MLIRKREGFAPALMPHQFSGNSKLVQKRYFSAYAERSLRIQKDRVALRSVNDYLVLVSMSRIILLDAIAQRHLSMSEKMCTGKDSDAINEGGARGQLVGNVKQLTAKQHK